MKDKRDEAVKLFLNFLFGSVYLLTAMILTGNWQPVIGFKGAAGSVYIGIFEMGITFFFWLKALSLATTTDKVSNLVYFAPFISLLFVHFIPQRTRLLYNSCRIISDNWRNFNPEQENREDINN